MDLSTDYPGETALASGFSFMRLLTDESPCVGAGCNPILASRHVFDIEGIVSNGADLTRAVDFPMAVFYDFGSPFSGQLRLDGGTITTASATSVPEPSTFALVALGALFCAMRNQRREAECKRHLRHQNTFTQTDWRE